MQKTNSSPEAQKLIAEQDALKKRAARQANKRELAPTVHSQVVCTVLPVGHDKISTGQHVGGIGDVYYEEGETFSTDLPIALQHYAKGWINFPNARDAQAQQAAEREVQAAADLREKEHLDKLLGSVA